MRPSVCVLLFAALAVEFKSVPMLVEGMPRKRGRKPNARSTPSSANVPPRKRRRIYGVRRTTNANPQYQRRRIFPKGHRLPFKKKNVVLGRRKRSTRAKKTSKRLVTSHIGNSTRTSKSIKSSTTSHTLENPKGATEASGDPIATNERNTVDPSVVNRLTAKHIYLTLDEIKTYPYVKECGESPIATGGFGTIYSIVLEAVPGFLIMANCDISSVYPYSQLFCRKKHILDTKTVLALLKFQLVESANVDLPDEYDSNAPHVYPLTKEKIRCTHMHRLGLGPAVYTVTYDTPNENGTYPEVHPNKRTMFMERIVGMAHETMMDHQNCVLLPDAYEAAKEMNSWVRENSSPGMDCKNRPSPIQTIAGERIVPALNEIKSLQEYLVTPSDEKLRMSINRVTAEVAVRLGLMFGSVRGYLRFILRMFSHNTRHCDLHTGNMLRKVVYLPRIDQQTGELSEETVSTIANGIRTARGLVYEHVHGRLLHFSAVEDLEQEIRNWLADQPHRENVAYFPLSGRSAVVIDMAWSITIDDKFLKKRGGLDRIGNVCRRFRTRRANDIVESIANITQRKVIDFSYRRDDSHYIRHGAIEMSALGLVTRANYTEEAVDGQSATVTHITRTPIKDYLSFGIDMDPSKTDVFVYPESVLKSAFDDHPQFQEQILSSLSAVKSMTEHFEKTIREDISKDNEDFYVCVNEEELTRSEGVIIQKKYSHGNMDRNELKRELDRILEFGGSGFSMVTEIGAIRTAISNLDKASFEFKRLYYDTNPLLKGYDISLPDESEDGVLPLK